MDATCPVADGECAALRRKLEAILSLERDVLSLAQKHSALRLANQDTLADWSRLKDENASLRAYADHAYHCGAKRGERCDCGYSSIFAA